MRQRQSHDSLDKHPTGRTPVRLCRRRSFRDWHCVPISMTTGVLPGVGTKRQSPSSRKNGGFTASAVKCWPQLTASKTLFQELARSANLPLLKTDREPSAIPKSRWVFCILYRHFEQNKFCEFISNFIQTQSAIYPSFFV